MKPNIFPDNIAPPFRMGTPQFLESLTQLCTSIQEEICTVIEKDSSQHLGTADNQLITALLNLKKNHTFSRTFLVTDSSETLFFKNPFNKTQGTVWSCHIAFKYWARRFSEKKLIDSSGPHLFGPIPIFIYSDPAFRFIIPHKSINGLDLFPNLQTAASPSLLDTCHLQFSFSREGFLEFHQAEFSPYKIEEIYFLKCTPLRQSDTQSFSTLYGNPL